MARPNLSREQLRVTVLEVLEPSLTVLGISHLDITDEDSLVDLGIVDSLSLSSMVASLEEKTGVQVDFSDIEPHHLTSISGLCRLFLGEPHG